MGMLRMKAIIDIYQDLVKISKPLCGVITYATVLRNCEFSNEW